MAVENDQNDYTNQMNKRLAELEAMGSNALLARIAFSLEVLNYNQVTLMGELRDQLGSMSVSVDNEPLDVRVVR